MTAGLSKRCFRTVPRPRYGVNIPSRDWAKIHQDLQTHKNLTLQLAWQEERESDPEGYAYSRFCDLYRRWLKKRDLVLRQEHRAGEKLFVDYAGDTIPIYDPNTGEVHQAAVFVAVLGASSYAFAEATSGQDLRNWIGSHIRAFEFLGGVTLVVVPDNLKSGVRKPSYYEPDLNPTYREWGEHYEVAIIPARPYRPRDKAKGGSGRSGSPALDSWQHCEKRRFFSLEEANQAIAGLLGRINQRPFRKREGTPRHSVRAAGPAGPPIPCLPRATSSPSGRKCASTSTITLRSSGIITACRTRWRIRKWKCV